MKSNIKQYALLIAMFLYIAAVFGCASDSKKAERTTASTGDKIGVPECDDYIEKYEACITGKMPESARAAMKSSFDQTRKTWKDLAANPQTKTTLASVCIQSKDAAKKATEAFKCDW